MTRLALFRERRVTAALRSLRLMRELAHAHRKARATKRPNKRFVGTKRLVKDMTWWNTVVPLMPDRQFEANFRISREIFNLVVEKMKTHHHFKRSPRHLKTTYCPRLYLATTLFRLAYGMPCQQVGERFGVSKGFVVKAAQLTLPAVIETMGDEWVGGLAPQTDAEYKAAAALMSRNGTAVFPGAFAALDVTHVRVVAYKWGAGLKKENFIDRKAVASISCQVWDRCARVHACPPPWHAHAPTITCPVSSLQCVVNGNMQFIDVAAGNSGNAHDSTILKHSKLGEFADTDIPGGYYIIADQGYPRKRWLVTPFPERIKEKSHTALREFNYRLSSVRMVIERTFGVLKSRFRALLHGFVAGHVDDFSDWFMFACILHNICRDRKLGVPDEPEEMVVDHGVRRLARDVRFMRQKYVLSKKLSADETAATPLLNSEKRAALKAMDGNAFVREVLCGDMGIRYVKKAKAVVREVAMAERDAE